MSERLAADRRAAKGFAFAFELILNLEMRELKRGRLEAAASSRALPSITALKMGLAISVLFESPPSLSLTQLVFQFILRIVPLKLLFDWPGGKSGFDAICTKEHKIFAKGPHYVPGDLKRAVDCSMMPFDLCHTHLLKTKGDETQVLQDEVTIMFIHGGAYVMGLWDSQGLGWGAGEVSEKFLQEM